MPKRSRIRQGGLAPTKTMLRGTYSLTNQLIPRFRLHINCFALGSRVVENLIKRKSVTEKFVEVVCRCLFYAQADTDGRTVRGQSFGACWQSRKRFPPRLGKRRTVSRSDVSGGPMA